MKKLLNLILLSILFTNISTAGEGSSYFGFKGKVFLADDKGGKVTVSLYDGNKKISSYVTGASGKFIVDLFKDRHYTLQFSKEGYVTKRVIIDTGVNPKDALGVKEFKFDIGLIKEESDKDYSELDFPITIIEFEKSKREFVYNKKYTNYMLDVQDRVLRDKGEMAQK